MAKSFTHPNMISNRTGMFKESTHKELVMQNIKLLLNTSKGEFFGDPFFGTSIRKLLFNPNDFVIKDLVIDDIASAIAQYVKEVTVNRSDIRIEQDKRGVINIKFPVYYNIDGTNNILSISIVNEG